MTRITVALGARSYPVDIENGLLDRAGAVLAPLARGGRLFLVTDENVSVAQLERFRAGCAGLTIDAAILPAGEGTKSWAQLEALTDRMLDWGVERGDHVVALGGGVIGDLVGFGLARSLKRGCHFVAGADDAAGAGRIPRSAARRRSMRAGKNLIGAFHQPACAA